MHDAYPGKKSPAATRREDRERQMLTGVASLEAHPPLTHNTKEEGKTDAARSVHRLSRDVNGALNRESAVASGASLRDAAEPTICEASPPAVTNNEPSRGESRAEVDVIEEVMRISGYSMSPSTLTRAGRKGGVVELDFREDHRTACARELPGFRRAIHVRFSTAESLRRVGLTASDRRSRRSREHP